MNDLIQAPAGRKRRRLAAIVATAVAAVAATLTVPTPASAGSAIMGCAARSGSLLSMGGTAFFDIPTPGIRQWTEFRYHLNGKMGNNSNVDIRIYDGPTLVYGLLSPDDRRAGVEYVVIPSPPAVLTTVDNAEEVAFEAIFDKFGYDPRCLATQVI